LLQVLRGPRGDALEPAGAIASAIGATQNVALIGPLAAILRERGASAVQRAAAAVAIGCLCDREPRPWNAELAATGDYRAATRSLLDPETGVLSWW
jgi:hypothetical protein